MEEYKYIPNFSKYRIYKDGRVYSEFKNRFLKGSINNIGYCTCVLKDDNGCLITTKIHRVIMLAYKGEPPLYVNKSGQNKRMEVNHIDGDKTNNKLSNLEYITHSENCKHNYLIDPSLKDRVGTKNGFKHTQETKDKMSYLKKKWWDNQKKSE